MERKLKRLEKKKKKHSKKRKRDFNDEEREGSRVVDTHKSSRLEQHDSANRNEEREKKIEENRLRRRLRQQQSERVGTVARDGMVKAAAVPTEELEEIEYLEKKLGVESQSGRDKLRRELEEIGLGDMDDFLNGLISTNLGINTFAGIESEQHSQRVLQRQQQQQQQKSTRDSYEGITSNAYEYDDVDYEEGDNIDDGRRNDEHDGAVNTVDGDRHYHSNNNNEEDDNGNAQGGSSDEASKYTQDDDEEEEEEDNAGNHDDDKDSCFDNSEDSDFGVFSTPHSHHSSVAAAAPSSNTYTKNSSSTATSSSSSSASSLTTAVAVRSAGGGQTQASKYVPPHLKRRLLKNDDSELRRQRIRREVNGLLNRLSYDNIQPIFSSLKTIYMDIDYSANGSPSSISRGDLTQLLSAIILKSCLDCGQTSVLLSVVEPQAALIAGLHVHPKIGDRSNIGAVVLESFCLRLDALLLSHGATTTTTTKEEGGEGKSTRQQQHSLISDKGIHNVLLFITCLYNFKVTYCGLIYEVIRRLLDRLLGIDVELLLLLLENCGWRLRDDDPAALKDIIRLIQKKVKQKNSNGKDEATGDITTHNKNKNKNNQPTARIRVLLDKIIDLKNNKRRRAAAEGRDLRSQPLRSWLLSKQTLKSSSSTKATNELQIRFEDFINIETKGRWWITGAAWRGKTDDTASSTQQPQGLHSNSSGASATWERGGGGGGGGGRKTTNESNSSSSNLMYLATSMRMNTALRKSIFCVIMGADDFIDAYEKIVKMRLSTIQSREVIRVLVRCCSSEAAYNPYYGYLAGKLCSNHRNHKFTLQLVYWDMFKQWQDKGGGGGGGGGDDKDDKNEYLMQTRKATNLGLLLAHLITSFSTSLSIFKVVDFNKLPNDTASLFFYTIFRKIMDAKEGVIVSVFERISGSMELEPLRDGIWFFFRRYLVVKTKAEKSLPPEEKKIKKIERAKLRRRIKLAVKTMKQS